MRSFRRKYYDFFSLIYDFIIRLHSRDKSGYLRRYLVDRAKVGEGSRVLDLCTGTGSVAIEFSGKVGKKGMVAGVDFSRGMLSKTRQKTEKMGIKNLYLIEANVSELPFKSDVFQAVTISHAFYELKGEERKKTIGDAARVLKEKGRFLMMEHEVPKNPLVKLLFYLRIYTMGSKDAAIFLKKDTLPFEGEFKQVKKETTPTAKSMLVWGEK